jgi:glycopeptide antibiotics resistance protein
MQLEFGRSAWLAGMGILAVLLILLRRRGGYFLFFLSLFWVYILELVSVTIFPIPLGPDVGNKFDNVWKLIAFMLRGNALNLVPLYFGNCWDLPRACATGIYENILMTVPFGFGINFLVRLKNRDFLWLALLVGLIIESVQFMLDIGLGGAFRSVDINDVLFNGLGVWLGYGLFRSFAGLYLAISKGSKNRAGGLSDYIQAVAKQTEPDEAEAISHLNS